MRGAAPASFVRGDVALRALPERHRLRHGDQDGVALFAPSFDGVDTLGVLPTRFGRKLACAPQADPACSRRAKAEIARLAIEGVAPNPDAARPTVADL